MPSEKPGVYLLTCQPTGRVYVGSTNNLSKRWSAHRQHLRAGRHRNRALQAAWDEHGADAFSWRILFYVEPRVREAMEWMVVYALRATDPERGFNCDRTGREWTIGQRAAAS